MMGLIGQSLSALPIKRMQATQLFNGCNLDDTQRQGGLAASFALCVSLNSCCIATRPKQERNVHARVVAPFHSQSRRQWAACMLTTQRQHCPETSPLGTDINNLKHSAAAFGQPAHKWPC